ncbi:predicted protein [Phaeodactylum tricornutum CCAP 1055/1]|uniref:Uncharacterized protein n=1 Tax=Phaeodactylum tricornutum (strain CCAP 1055/1) TaxID=556484 RepID=B7FSP7_PHATC|nr:predicted protein [Phaeodactylum tricornutum CCAP 1055/1]EEC50514.1 predicted protein [Phaeodactylum tricornutum CCAP 1055/1]|eukprot:XP_002177700.1 predicted protein [Phaeodactylum tricornutum CCAP 1055/1]
MQVARIGSRRSATKLLRPQSTGPPPTAAASPRQALSRSSVACVSPFENRGIHFHSGKFPSPSTRRNFSSSSIDGIDTVEHALASSNVKEAQSALDKIPADSSLTLPDLQSLRGRVLDAWLEHQENLLEIYNYTSPERSHLREICLAAESAHNLLEQIEPLFSNSNLTSYSIYGEEFKSDLDVSDEEALRRPMKPYNTVLTQRCNAVLRAWARTSRAGQGINTRLTRAIPQRAQFLLEGMELSYENGSDRLRTVLPTVESFNQVLEAWAYSDEHLRGAMAEQLFQKLRHGNPAAVHFNGRSYRLIIAAWSWSRERRHAFNATGHLMKMLRKLEKGDESMEPTMDDYHMILKAWTNAEDRMAPTKAESVLQLMDYAYNNGITFLQPDITCYRCVLVTAARRRSLPELGRLVDNLLMRMKERLMVPDTLCYQSAITTWKNVALNHEFPENVELGVRRTIELLTEMKLAESRSTLVSVKPSTINYNDVIEALTASSHPRRIQQAQHLLSEMESEFFKRGNNLLKPSANSYRLMIEVLNSVASVKRVVEAKAVVLKMSDKFDELFDASHMSRKENKAVVVATFNAFIRLCATTPVEAEDEGMRILREALAVVDKMRSHVVLEPNSATYAALLEACKDLLPIGPERRRLVEMVFRVCCDEGMVNHIVLKELRDAATSEQYTKMVVAYGEEMEGKRMVPEAWTIKALGDRVCTEDGRKAKPLGVDEIYCEVEDLRWKSERSWRW